MLNTVEVNGFKWEVDSEEWVEWARLTPQERWAESAKLWEHYLSMGGSLDPEPDTQSPFYFPPEPSAPPADGRPSDDPLRRGGIQPGSRPVDRLRCIKPGGY